MAASWRGAGVKALGGTVAGLVGSKGVTYAFRVLFSMGNGRLRMDFCLDNVGFGRMYFRRALR